MADAWENALGEDDMGLFQQAENDKGSDGLSTISEETKGSKQVEVMKNCAACSVVCFLAPGSCYCWDHKRVVEGMVGFFKSQDKKLGTKTGDTFAKKRKDFKGKAAPNDLSRDIMDYEIKNPRIGKGSKRIKLENMETSEVQRNSTGTRKGTKLVKMHFARWMKHAVEVMCYPAEWAKEKWMDAEANTPKNETDDLGPPNSKVRLPMPFEDFIEGFAATSHEKNVALASKKQKITDDRMDEAQEDMEVDFKSFSNSVFKSTGGDALVAAGKTGMTSEVNLRGQGAFNGTPTPKQNAVDEVATSPDDKERVQHIVVAIEVDGLPKNLGWGAANSLSTS